MKRRLNAHVAAVVAMLAAHAGLLAYNAWRQSPTIDEPAHLVAGLNYWRTGRFELYAVNPPLVRLVGALPVLFMEPNLAALNAENLQPDSATQRALGRVEFGAGTQFASDNGPRFFTMMTAARLACIPFSLLGAVCCYLWAKALYGSTAGLFAMAIWCVFPEVLAHGSLMTNDVPSAAMAVWSGYLFWKWMKQPTPAAASLAGLVLGIALLTKFTLLLFVALWPAMWLLARVTTRPSLSRAAWLRELSSLSLSLLIALLVLNAGYLFQGTFSRLGSHQFTSHALSGIDSEWTDSETANRFSGSWLGGMRVPLPSAMIRGIDQQKQDFEKFQPARIGGRSYDGGVWYFHLYAALVKWPLGFWLLLWLAAIVGGCGESWTDRLCLLGPPLAILIVTSLSSSIGFFRYMLPATPFLIVCCGRTLAPQMLPAWRQYTPPLVAGGWLLVSSLLVYPYSLAYFNEFAGGPRNGHAHLIDCNIDWGQDMLEFKRWMDEHPDARPLYYVCNSMVDPQLAGIEVQFPEIERWVGPNGIETEISPGYHAISVNALRGATHFAFGPNGIQHAEEPSVTCFLEMEPIAVIGYTIYVYRIEAP